MDETRVKVLAARCSRPRRVNIKATHTEQAQGSQFLDDSLKTLPLEISTIISAQQMSDEGGRREENKAQGGGGEGLLYMLSLKTNTSSCNLGQSGPKKRLPGWPTLLDWPCFGFLFQCWVETEEILGSDGHPKPFRYSR